MTNAATPLDLSLARYERKRALYPLASRVMDDPYFSERELFFAYLADGLDPALALLFVQDVEDARLEDWRREADAEAAAENAWLIHAERYDHEAQMDLYR
jgi:hypothetical protein